MGRVDSTQVVHKLLFEDTRTHREEVEREGDEEGSYKFKGEEGEEKEGKRLNNISSPLEEDALVDGNRIWSKIQRVEYDNINSDKVF